MEDQNPFLARLQEESQRNRFDMNRTVGDRMAKLQEASEARNKELDALYQQRVQAENSWVGKLGLDEQGIAGQTVNTAAGLVSGASSHILGTLATLPANVGAAAEMQGITQEDMDAYAAMQTGTATPEQEALLGREIKSQGTAVDLWRNLKGQSDTVKGRLDNVKDLNEFSRNTSDVFDIGSIVNRQGQADLEGDLRKNFQDNWSKVTEGSATDKVAGVAGLLKEAVSAGVNNKDGLLSFLSENLPQMALGLLGKGGKAAMLATNVGYGFDNFQKGVEEFQKENGRMPAEEELDRILGWSAAGALAEQIGDVSVLRGFGVGKGATQAASGAATKRGVGATVAGIGTGTAQGFGSEAATEAFQTYAENQAQSKETFAEDLYVAGSIGGLVGGSMRGGLSTADAVGQGASAVAEKGAEFAQAQAEKKAAVEEAVKTGDVSKYTDPASATYAPDTAVEALYAVARDSTDPVVSSEKLQEANGVVSTLREELNTIEEQLTAKTAEQTQLEDQDIDGFSVEQIEAYENQLEALDSEVAQLSKRKEQLTKPLARSEKVMEQFTRVAAALTPEQKIAPKTSQEVDGVINLSMAAPAQISDEALTALASNPQASDSQKAYASAALAFRAASKTAEQVNTNVLYGEANGLKGIQQYRKDITTSVAAGDTATATKQLDRMKQFTARHTSKAEVASQVLAERQASGDTAQVSIAPDSNGVWAVLPNTLTEAQRKKVGGLNLHRGSGKVVAAAQSEVKALDAAVAEMEAAIATKATASPAPAEAPVRSSSSNVSSSAAEPASSKPSSQNRAPAPRQSQDQKGVVQSPLSPDNKGKGKEVVGQAQATPSESSKTKTTPKQITKVEPFGEATARSNQLASEQEATVGFNQDLFNDLDEAIKDMVEGVEGAQERVAELQEAIDRIGNPTDGAILYALNEPKQTNVSNLGDPKVFGALNLFTQYFYQQKQSDVTGTTKPLASMKNFLSAYKNDSTVVNQFVKDGVLSSEQAQAIKHMFDTITTRPILKNGTKGKSWLDRIEDNLVKPSSDGAYRYRDMIQFLQYEDGSKQDLDENIKVAMAYSLYSWMAENAKGTKYNTHAQIQAMLGLPKDEDLSLSVAGALFTVGKRDKMVINDFGKRVVEALGIRADKNAPEGLDQNLIASIGTHVLKLAEDVDLLERSTVTNAELNRIIAEVNGNPTTSGYTKDMDPQTMKLLAQKEKNSVQYFYRAKFNDQGELTGLASQIQQAQEKKQSILNKLFGVENFATAPTTKPNLQDQVTAAKTKEALPKLANDIRKEENSAPFRILTENFKAIAAMDRDAVLAMMGYDFSDLSTQHIDKRRAIEAKNFGYEQEYDNFMAFVADMGDGNSAIDQDLFFNHEYWSNHRVGISETLINPQASKFQRALMTRPDWATEVDLNEPSGAMLNSLKLRIMEGFGHKTEKGKEEISLAKFDTEVLANPVIMAGVRAIIDTRLAAKEESMTPEQNEAVKAAVAAGKEKMHSFSSLFGLAQLIHAQETGADKFITNVTAEIDGVTNGPVLSHILLGAAGSVKQLFASVGNRGGFFAKGDTNKQYSSYRGQAGVEDLYEKLMSTVLGHLDMNSVAMKQFTVIAGALTDSSGKVASAGRNLVKTPLTALVFGSSVGGAFASMTNKFQDTVLKKIEEVEALKVKATPESMEKAKTILKAINYMMIEQGGLPRDQYLRLNSSLLETPLTNNQKDAIKAAFKQVMYKPVNKGMKALLGNFIKRRATFNAAANAAFAVYNAAKQGITQQLLEEGMDNGTIPFTVQNTDRDTGLKLPKPVRHPSIGLTAELRAELDKRLEKIKPILPTIYSKESGQSRAGVALEKTEQVLSGERYGEQEVKFGTPTKIGTKSLLTSGFMERSTGPGVRMLPMATHSLDSGISHFALMSYFNNNEELKGMHTQVLNVHDAHIVGLGAYETAGKNLNRSTYNSLLRYSPFVEMRTVLFDTVDGMTELLRDPKSAKAIQPFLAQALNSLKYDNQDIRLSQLLEVVSAETATAEQIRLGFLVETGSVDQYAAFRGNHEVATNEQAQAEKLLELAKADTGSIPNRVLEGAVRMGVLANANKQTLAPLETDPELAMETFNEKVGSIMQAYLSPAKAATAAQHMPEDSKVRKAVAEGKTPKEALDSLSPEEAAAEATDMVTVASAMTPTTFSPWGAIGNPAIESDAQMVAAMVANPVMGKDAALALVASKIQALPDGTNKDYLRTLYALLKRTLPDNLSVRYVTPETSSNDVMAKGAENSRGWYMAKDGNNHVYVLSPDHMHSGLTLELLMHEMTHASLAGTIESVLANREEADPKVVELVDALEELRKNAVDYMTANQLNDMAPAVVNVHEFVSWGMTNKDFQDKVLKNIKGTSKDFRSGALRGLASFVNKLVGLLFKGQKMSKQELMENGLTIMIQQSSGLFKMAATKQYSPELVLDMVNTNPATPVENMSITEMFDAVADTNPNNVVSPTFGIEVKSILDSLGTDLHNSMGALIAEARKDKALTPLDVYAKTLATGQLPFAARSLAAGFKVNNQEALAMEQIEAVLRAALKDNTTQTSSAYTELRRVYEAAQKQIRPKDLLPDGVTESTATPAQMQAARAMWEGAFRVDGPDFLAKFAALALGNETFASKLGFDASRTVRDGTTLWERAMQAWDRLVNLLVRKLTGTSTTVTAKDFVQQLAQDLVTIETKRQAQLANNKNTLFDSIEEGMEKAGDFGRDKVEALANSKFFKNAKNGYVRGAGTVISVVAGPQRALAILDAVNSMRKDALMRRQDMFSSLITEMRGLDGVKAVFLKMLMATKNIERERSKMGEYMRKTLLKSFARKKGKFTKEEQAALTQLMRNDVGALTNQYTMAEIQQLMEDPAFLQNEINKFEAKVRKHPWARDQLNMSRGLGYHMATGVARYANVQRNAHNIARMGGTDFLGKVPESLAIGLEADIDVLVSLYATQYTPTNVMNAARNVLREEMNRTDGGNGVEVLLKVHRELQAESKKSLFENSEALAIKGYLPEVTNPYVSFKVADAVEGAELVKMGYEDRGPAAKDPNDPSQNLRIYTIRDGGIARWTTGSMSFTGNQRKGTANQRDGSWEVYTLNKDKLASLPKTLIDPRLVQDTYMVPVMNPSGQVVNYVYTASNEFRDNVLERDNRFDHLIGTLAGNTYDKIESPVQNKNVLEALKAQYDLEIAAGNTNLLRVAPDSEFSDLWNMLPDQTKKDAESIFGGKEIFIRNDMEDLIFGYRKQSLANLWDKQRKSSIEHFMNKEFQAGMQEVFMEFIEVLVRGWARHKGHDVDAWLKRAPMLVRNGEDIWQSLVAETKDIIVVRTGFVLWGNIMSNMSVLKVSGVPIKDMIRHHVVALKAASAYEKDSQELNDIQTMLATGVLKGNDRADLENRAKLLEDSITRNPVKELIDAGLMPTIVEDLGTADDIYSYKNLLARKAEKYTNKINPTVKKGLEFAYVGQKTPLYQGLNRATQLSDFVARYTLFHHLQERKIKPMSREDAITRASDAFVNYDIPTHRNMQFMNDMGLFIFTKYYLRIQRVLLQLFAEKPANMLMLGMFSGFFEGVETIMDSNMLGRIGNNPFTVGALKYPTVLDDLITVNAAISLK